MINFVMSVITDFIDNFLRTAMDTYIATLGDFAYGIFFGMIVAITSGGKVEEMAGD